MGTEGEERDITWLDLYRKTKSSLQRFGYEEPTGDGDYWVVDDNYGWRRQIINIFSLKMLSPEIVSNLRILLNDFPEWEIVMALDIPGKEDIWPRMGLTIRKHEIIDGLRREYLPEPYRQLVIPDSKPGTGDD